MSNTYEFTSNYSFVVSGVNMEQALQLAKFLTGRYDFCKIKDEQGAVQVYHWDTDGVFVPANEEE